MLPSILDWIDSVHEPMVWAPMCPRTYGRHHSLPRKLQLKMLRRWSKTWACAAKPVCVTYTYARHDWRGSARDDTISTRSHRASTR